MKVIAVLQDIYTFVIKMVNKLTFRAWQYSLKVTSPEQYSLLGWPSTMSRPKFSRESACKKYICLFSCAILKLSWTGSQTTITKSPDVQDSILNFPDFTEPIPISLLVINSFCLIGLVVTSILPKIIKNKFTMEAKIIKNYVTKC